MSSFFDNLFKKKETPTNKTNEDDKDMNKIEKIPENNIIDIQKNGGFEYNPPVPSKYRTTKKPIEVIVEKTLNEYLMKNRKMLGGDCGCNKIHQMGGNPNVHNVGYCDGQPSQCMDNYTQCGAGLQNGGNPNVHNVGYCDGQPSQCMDNYTQCGAGIVHNPHNYRLNRHNSHNQIGGNPNVHNVGYCDGQPSQCMDNYTQCGAGHIHMHGPTCNHNRNHMFRGGNPNVHNVGYCDGQPSQCMDNYTQCGAGKSSPKNRFYKRKSPSNRKIKSKKNK